ncbi:MAG: TonB-dependent receptor [Acidobacteria bacterium]|nr:MAG: TonB-dependent receptor [Acidobacteriota bacterium]
MSVRTKLPLALLALLAARGLPADAAGPGDEGEDRPGVVEERVEVEAEAAGEDDVAAFATVLGEEAIAGRAADLADLLRRVPGARVRDYGGLGRFATVSLRGSTAEQVTVLVDGVPQNRALGGPVDLSPIPLTQVRSVTVYRGIPPVAAGLDGLGGVVDIRTREPGAPAAGAEILYGSLGTERIAASWSGRAGARWRLRVGAERFRSRGDFDYLDLGAPLVAGDERRQRRSNNDVAGTSWVIRAFRHSRGGGRFEFGWRGLDREGGIPGTDGLPARFTRLGERQQEARLSWERRLRSGSVSIAADRTVRRDRLRDPFGEVGIGIQDQTTRLTSTGAALLWRGRRGRHRWLLRADARRERARVRDAALAVSDRGGLRRTRMSIAAEDVVGFGRLAVAPALRIERRTDRFVAGGEGLLPPPAPSAGETRVTGKLGLSLALGRNWSLRASAGRFDRPPDLLELFGDRGTVVGNPGLRPERGTKLELGIARAAKIWAGTRWRAGGELVAFATDARDLILLWPTSPGAVVATNFDRARIRGLEASVSLQRGAFAAELSGTLQRATDASGGFADGFPLPGRPDREGFAALSWNFARDRVGWEVTYVGENPTDRLDTPALRLPARVLHDVRYGHRFGPPGSGVELGVEVRNLFDRETRDVARFPLPGRTLFVRLAWGTGEERP